MGNLGGGFTPGLADLLGIGRVTAAAGGSHRDKSRPRVPGTIPAGSISVSSIVMA
jgi:hypothetical protein